MINPLDFIFVILFYWFFIGTIGSLLLQWGINGLKSLFLLSTLGSIGLFVVSSFTFDQLPSSFIIPWGIPGYPLHFHWDKLSAFFVLLLSATSIGISLFASHYFRHMSTHSKGLLCFHYHWLLTSMVCVFLAADAYSFLIAWEFMAISSYFLMVAFKLNLESLHAGFLYLLITHLGAIAILMCFSVMCQETTDFTFSAMSQAHLTPFYATLAFVFALAGFGAKAGLLPLHVWLPEAYSAAPSPVSALMSGVMLKTAIYGIIRIVFTLLPNQQSSWGLVVLILGLLTALLGVILAAVQTEMKRLLAYSSVENSGIIITGIGLSLLFNTAHHTLLAALALSASLFHCFNHALFKSLLFLSTGSVLHATGERHLGKLGGLIARMPWVAGSTLVGTLAIAGLPPLNGFVSEWLLFQAFLFCPQIPAPYLTMIIPVAAAAFALTIGLGVYVMVKFYGTIFLGKPRETQLAQAHDAGLLERCGLGWLALGCIILGLCPWLLLNPLKQVTALLFNQINLPLYSDSSLLLVVPVSATRASYSPLLFFMIICLFFVLVHGLIYTLYHNKLRRAPLWDGGFPAQTGRMQDTAEGFGQPIKQMFHSFLYIRLALPNPFDRTPHYHVQTEDRFWHALYLPLLRFVIGCARGVSKLQQGRISHYLFYSFLTLIILLWWVL